MSKVLSLRSLSLTQQVRNGLPGLPNNFISTASASYLLEEWRNALMSIKPISATISHSIWFLRSSAFLLTSCFLGILWFALIAMVLSLGEKLLIVGIGLPILLLSLLIVRQAVNIERARLTRFLGITIHPTYQPITVKVWWRRILAFASDPALWRDWLYIFLLLPLGIFDLVVFILAFCAPIGLLVTLLSSLWIENIALLHFLAIDSWLKVFAVTLLGLLWIWAGSYVIIGTAQLHGICAQNLLGVPLSVRMAALAESRTQVLEAALSERQRIARDLHDGAQQNLIALAMDLGMAKEKLETEPEMARTLIIKAHDQAKRSLAELRDLVRGIYPAILTDRGLDAALSALAGRSPVPVTVTVQLKERFPELIESTAYFIVAEALTNIAKHSSASSASVTLSQEQKDLIIEIRDNGHGGAKIARGAGLAGIQDRLKVLEGTLTISSPPGGPTYLRGVLPCAL
jgi:signal transduction histidine kinase